MSELKTSHGIFDCLYWNLFALIPILTACVAIGRRSVFWLVVYILMALAQFLILQYRFFCSHCPHYTREGRTTKCMFIWGIPKYFKPRTEPLGPLGKLVLAVGLGVVVLFPIIWLRFSTYLLLNYLLSVAVMALTMRRYECGRCLFFDCPVNTVPQETIESYWRNR